ncbi:hypothetical protein D9M71_522680 [compost metagenome]
MVHHLQLLFTHWKCLKRLAGSLDRQQLGSLDGIAHELLARDDGAVIGNGQMAHAVHLLF